MNESEKREEHQLSGDKRNKAVFIYDPRCTAYRFHDGHPFNQRRVTWSYQLLRQGNWLSDEEMVLPPSLDEHQLSLVHDAGYVEAIRSAQHDLINRRTYGFDEDTPCFEGMHEAARQICAGSVHAVDQVMLHDRRALHLAGGLHHAHAARASGFCIYNDAALAIAHARDVYGLRVLYIDTDVHHGDGVQWLFYSDPDVFTYSIHETGKFLFPGTGSVTERGVEQGFGTTLNVPIAPYTEDDSWLECFQETIEVAAAAFQPDLIISQHGCDAHAYDPLSHIYCSMRIYAEMPKIIRRLADRYCKGKWVALGGGGYDHHRVVPRAWGLLWLVMKQHPLADSLGHADRLPADWIEDMQQKTSLSIPTTWLDAKNAWAPMPRREIIVKENRAVKELARSYYSSFIQPS
ncbi:acetoin utilization protein AcuC [Marinicrinis sediminis]|uniref:Acetoin utilization protein AcuC n=1 Tax=Marinicrinis sediminis TaxID=1652465 RepID=A0ABW5R658_9BACL